MPIIKSAKKAARQAVKRTEHNKSIKKDIETAIKAFKASPTAEALSKAQSELDKAVKKNLLKKNTASRRKAKLHAIAKEAGVKLERVAKKATAATKKPAAEKTTRSVSKDAPRGTRSNGAKRTKSTVSE